MSENIEEVVDEKGGEKQNADFSNFAIESHPRFQRVKLNRKEPRIVKIMV